VTATTIAVGKCHVCTRNDTAGATLYCCVTCNNRLLRLLREIGIYWTILPLMTAPRRGQTGRMSPGYGPRSPGNDDVISALDPRSRPGDVDEDGEAILRRPDDTANWVRSLGASLTGIAEGIAAERDEQVAGAPIDYVRATLWWCGDRAWITDIATDLTELHRQARSLACDRPQAPLAECMVVTCDGQVFEGGPGQPARCAACNEAYDGLRLIRLRAAVAAAQAAA
jgi:hypothetical protein